LIYYTNLHKLWQESIDIINYIFNVKIIRLYWNQKSIEQNL